MQVHAAYIFTASFDNFEFYLKLFSVPAIRLARNTDSVPALLMGALTTTVLSMKWKLLPVMI